jgi:OmpA-OmpF porin, OOP family
MNTRKRRIGRLQRLTVAGALGSLLVAWNTPQASQRQGCEIGHGLCYDIPINAGPLINTGNFDGGPSLSQDGLTLFFGSARRNSLGRLDEDIYMAQRENHSQPFGAPQNLGPTVNSLGFADFSPELSMDGLTLYFASNRQPGGFGSGDLYVTRRSSLDDPWEPPENLGPGVNTEFFEGQPSISANGKTLYWDSLRPGFGDFDIWMANRKHVEEPFSSAENLGQPVNGTGPDFGPAISQNEKRLFFSSGRPGNIGQLDIWVVERENRSDPWGNPVNIETLNSPVFQAAPTFGRNGRDVCFMSIRPGGFGVLDVWCATRLE